MESTFTKILAAEFVWGVVLGSLLTIAGAFMVHYLSDRNRKASAVELLRDLIRSLTDLIQTLIDCRDRDERVGPEFLDSINAEIAVYNRNRESLVLLRDAGLRKDIREYFARMAGLFPQLHGYFGKFREFYFQSLNDPDLATRSAAEDRALYSLFEAHRICDELAKMRREGEKLHDRLGST